MWIRNTRRCAPAALSGGQRGWFGGLWSCALLLVGPPAAAQYSVPPAAADSVSSGRVGSARQKVQAGLVREGGWELGASLNFITAGESLGDQELEFTDLMLLRLHGLASLGGTLELFGGTDILPKQPSYTDELVWQGALLGGRVALSDAFAVWLRGSVGPQLGGTGWWLAGDSAVQFKLSLEEVLFFESALGVAHTQLLFDADTSEAFFQDELFTQVGIALRDPGGNFGAWLSFDYYLPVRHQPQGPDPDEPSASYLDPQPRVNLHLGGLISISPQVDLFLEWSILDRGDLEAPATRLPILNGGFDQQQLLFGFMRRFGGRSRAE